MNDDKRNTFTCNLKSLNINKPNIKKARIQEAIAHNINEINKAVLPSPKNVKAASVLNHLT